MRNSVKNYSTKDWLRLAAKLGLLFTKPRVRKAVGDRISEGIDSISDTAAGSYDDVNDTVSSKYGDAVDRLKAAQSALQGRSSWPSPVTGFLLGVGVGAGLGLILAPASGVDTRRAVRNRAIDMKNEVFGSAAERIHRTVANIPFTGTEG